MRNKLSAKPKALDAGIAIKNSESIAAEKAIDSGSATDVVNNYVHNIPEKLPDYPLPCSNIISGSADKIKESLQSSQDTLEMEGCILYFEEQTNASNYKKQANASNYKVTIYPPSCYPEDEDKPMHVHVNGISTKLEELFDQWLFIKNLNLNKSYPNFSNPHFVWNNNDTMDGIDGVRDKNIEKKDKDNPRYPAMRTVYKLLNTHTIERISAHSNGNYMAMGAIILAAKKQGKMTNKITYYGMAPAINSKIFNSETKTQLQNFLTEESTLFIQVLDFLNLLKLFNIDNAYGWTGVDKIGNKKIRAAALALITLISLRSSITPIPSGIKLFKSILKIKIIQEALKLIMANGVYTMELFNRIKKRVKDDFNSWESMGYEVVILHDDSNHEREDPDHDNKLHHSFQYHYEEAILIAFYDVKTAYHDIPDDVEIAIKEITSKKQVA